MNKKTYKRILSEVQKMEAVGGMDMHEMLGISDELRQILTWVIRTNRFQTADLAAKVGLDPPSAQRLLDVLTLKGFVEFEVSPGVQAGAQDSKENASYHASVTTSRFTRRYVVPKDVWKLFDD